MSRIEPEVAEIQAPSFAQGLGNGSTRTPPSDEGRFLIQDIDWSGYKKIAEALGERHFRISYDGWSMELMTKSSRHCASSRLFAMLIVVLAEELRQPVACCGGMTCDRDDLQRGLEPDECFYLTNAARVRGRNTINLEIDPPPDLAVEVDLTTDSRRRLGIYAALGIPEIWRYDGQAIFILQRDADGQYVVVEHSRYFPIITGQELLRFVGRPGLWEATSLLSEFRAWVREQISKSSS